eukprot:s2895_g2.t1
MHICPTIMWKLLATCSMVAMATIQDEIDVLVKADKRLMQQVQEIRSCHGFVTVSLSASPPGEALAKRTEWNRDAIVKVATLSQGELLALLSKELGEVKQEAEQVLPEAGAYCVVQYPCTHVLLHLYTSCAASPMSLSPALAQSAAQQVEKEHSEAKENRAAEAAKLKEVAEWLQSEFSREDAQLKSMMEETKNEADAAAKATQNLLKERDSQLKLQIEESRRKIANVTRMVEKSLPQERLDFQQQLGEMGQKLEAVALAFEDSRYESVNETLDGIVLWQRVNFYVIIPSLLIGMIGILAFHWYGEHPYQGPVSAISSAPLLEPLLPAPVRADSEISFSVVTPQASVQVHRFLPGSAVSSTEGTVEAAALRPKAVVRSAVGTPLEVLSVTFRHVSECEVVELILCEDLPATTVVASHRVMIVGQPGSCRQVVTASELRVGDRIALAGADAEVCGVCLRSVGEVTVIEVEFSSDEPVGTLLDVGDQQLNFHIV